MRQGMDRGKSGGDRRGTSRVQKPATGRMNVQQPGTARREAQQQDGRGGPPAQQQDKTMLYVGIGGGALVFVLILAFMMCVGLVSCGPPARRALRIQPTEAMREDQ